MESACELFEGEIYYIELDNINNVKAGVFKKLKPFNKMGCQIYEHVFQEMIKKHVKSFISF